MMDPTDPLKVIHAAPLFAAKRREHEARQRAASEGLRAHWERIPQTAMERFMDSKDSNGVDLPASASREDALKIASEHGAKQRLGNINAVIVQVPHDRIDQRLRCISSLVPEG
jgi:hypothetical protein